MIVYLARAIQAFVMYCVNGTSRSSLLIESTDSMIPIQYSTSSTNGVVTVTCYCVYCILVVVSYDPRVYTIFIAVVVESEYQRKEFSH